MLVRLKNAGRLGALGEVFAQYLDPALDRAVEQAPSPVPLVEDVEIYERDALIVYTGSFETMDGPVKVTERDIRRVWERHNARLGTIAATRGTFDWDPGDLPPIQVDHTESGWDTVGRVWGYVWLGRYTPIGETKERLALYGRLRFLGRENCARARDGRFANISIGADFSEGVLNEVTVIPFAAAREARLMPEVPAGESARLAAGSETGDDTDSGVRLAGDSKTATYRGHKIRAEKSGKGFKVYLQVKGEDDEEFFADGYDTAQDAIDEVKEWLDFNKLGGRSMDKEKLKRHLMKTTKCSEKDAEERLAKCSEDEVKKLTAAAAEDEAKMASGGGGQSPAAPGDKALSAEDKEKEKLAAEEKEKQDKLAAEKEEKERLASEEEKERKEREKDEKDEKDVKSLKKRMSAARGGFVKLARGMRSGFRDTGMEAKKVRLAARLNGLRAKAAITPAELKRYDVEELAKKSDEALEAFFLGFENREPVIDVGIHGNAKAVSVARLATGLKERAQLASSLANMPFTGKTVGKQLGLDPDQLRQDDMAANVGGATEGPQPLDEEFAEVTKLIDSGSRDKGLARLRAFMKSQSNAALAGYVPGASEGDARLSALAEKYRTLENQFDELVAMVAPILGVEAEELAG